MYRLLTAAFALVVSISAFTHAATYGGGSGTEQDPYQISSTVHWQELMANPFDWGSSFVLTAEIDLEGTLLTPVGNADIPFTGVFDGNSHTISNVEIDTPDSDYVGLFGFVGSGGRIKNLGVVDAKIRGCYHVGGLVGVVSYYGNTGAGIDSCYVTGVVSGEENIGGLCGYNGGGLGSCHSTALVNGKEKVGGLCGYNGSYINSCYATGNVIGDKSVGGLCGFNGSTTNQTSIDNCYSIGSVNGNSAVGGLVGDNVGDVTSCYATASVNGIEKVGGLCGSNQATIKNCYSTGPATGNFVIGGLVGDNQSKLRCCYSIAYVNGNNYTGGLVGKNGDSITACFWDIQTSGQMTSAGGTGKTTAEMQTFSTFTDAGWDCSYLDGDLADWIILANRYPCLPWEIHYNGGSGTAEDPYKILSVPEYLVLCDTPSIWNKCFILKADIDLTGIVFNQSPISPDIDNIDLLNDFQGTPFTGVFDGNGHTISHLMINAINQDYIGLFGCLGYGGQVKNIGIKAADIHGRYYVGGVCGANYSATIIRSHFITS